MAVLFGLSAVPLFTHSPLPKILTARQFFQVENDKALMGASFLL